MLEVVLPEKSYEIIIERNALDHVSEVDRRKLEK